MARKLIFVFLLSSILAWLVLTTVFAEDKPTSSEVIPKLAKTANDPELSNGHVYPEWGPVCQRYTYSVIYRDKEGRKPEYVKIYFNGKMIDMTPVVTKAAAGKDDYKKGIRYEYKFVPNKIDSNFYYFEASNGLGKTRDSIIDSPDNGPVLFASVFAKNEIVLIESATGKKIWSYPTKKEWVGGVALSDDGQYLAALTSRHVYFFATAKNEPLWQYEFNQGSAIGGGPRGNGIAISQDGSRIVAAAGMEVVLFSRNNNKPLWKYSSPALAVAISKDGRYLAASAVKQDAEKGGNVVLFWEAKNNQPIKEFGADSNFHDVALSADGQYFVASTGCPDRKAYLFSKDSPKPLIESERLTFDSPVSKSKISADGSLAAFATEGGPDSSVVVFFSKDSARPLWKFTNQKQNSSRALGLTPDGKFLAAATMKGDVYLLTKNSNQPIKTWQTNSSVGALDIADDASFIALGGSDNQVWILPRDSGEKKIQLNEFVQSLDISADGRVVAAGTGGSVYFFESYLSPNKNKVFSCEKVIEPTNESQMMQEAGYGQQVTSSLCGDKKCEGPETVANCQMDCDPNYKGRPTFAKSSETKLPGMLTGFGFLGSALLLAAYFAVVRFNLLRRKSAASLKLNKKIVLGISLLTALFLLLTLAFMVLNKRESVQYEPEESASPREKIQNKQQPEEGSSVKQGVCGNDLCEPGLGESKENCAKDCSAGQ